MSNIFKCYRFILLQSGFLFLYVKWSTDYEIWEREIDFYTGTSNAETDKLITRDLTKSQFLTDLGPGKKFDENSLDYF